MRKIKSVLSILLAVLIAISVPFTVSAVEVNSYTVTLTQDSKVKYSGVSRSSFEIKSTAYRSIYAKVVKELQDEYYVDSIETTPENAADITFYRTTGEVFIENVKSDFELTPVVKAKTAADSLSVSWDFVKGGVYSEDNAAATVSFTVDVKDSEGNPAVNAKLYYKSDKSEKSFTNAATTDTNGQATFKHAYALNEGEYEADFTAQFATDSKFTANVEETTFKVVLQKQSDLYLTTDQVKASRTNNNNDGGVINVNPKYEYFTGALHQKAINTASGEWVTPDNGTISGLAPGQYALRFKEYVDGNTIYLHSDYDYFTIDRAIWTVTADVENSPNVSFADTVLYAAPGGDVFFYVTPDNGYKLTDYTVSKPSYVSDVVYNEEDGYIWIKGVTGSVSLTVKAEAEGVQVPVAVKTVAKSLKAQALGAAVGASDDYQVNIIDVYPYIDSPKGVYDGQTIAVKVQVLNGQNPVTGLSASNLTIIKDSGNKVQQNQLTDLQFIGQADEEGIAILRFNVAKSKTYVLHVEYQGTKSEPINITKVWQPASNTLPKTDLKIEPTKGSRKNGSITYTGTAYNGNLGYNLSGKPDNYTVVNGKKITNLDEGSYYVYLAADVEKVDDGYEVRIRQGFASNGNYKVEEVEDSSEDYTVTFVNAAGETVDTRTYTEGTAANEVTVPANTASKTVGNKVYTYSWPTINDVTGDVTYTEIETVTVKKTASVSITDINQNFDSGINNSAEGKILNYSIKLTDDNGNITGQSNNLKLYAKGAAVTSISVSEIGNGEYTLTSKKDLNIGSNTVYVVFENDEYVSSVSNTVNVSITQPNQPTLYANPDYDTSDLGQIIIKSDYNEFIYYRQGTTENNRVTGKIINGLKGSNDDHVSSNYFVYVAPIKLSASDNQFEFLAASAKSNIVVGNEGVDGITYYSVKFVNANNEEVSSIKYASGTETENVYVPDNTPDTETVSYSWPTIAAVTANVTYNEIVTGDVVKKDTATSIKSISLNETGDAFVVTVEVKDAEGEPVANQNVQLNFNESSTAQTNESGVAQFTVNAGAGEYNVDAQFAETAGYNASVSETKTVSVTKADKPSVTASEASNGQANGSITISGDYDKYAYYKANGEVTETAEKTITGLYSGTYYVYAPGTAVEGEADYNFRLTSDRAEAVVNNLVVVTYTVTSASGIEIIIPEGRTAANQLYYNDQVTVKGTDVKAWSVNGNIVAYGAAYTFRVYGDVDVQPVYTLDGDVEPEVKIVSIQKDTNTHLVKFFATITVPEDYEVVSYGFVFGKNVSKTDLVLEKVGQNTSGTQSYEVPSKIKNIENDFKSLQFGLAYGFTNQTPGEYIGARAFIRVKKKDSNDDTTSLIYSTNYAVYQYPIILPD